MQDIIKYQYHYHTFGHLGGFYCEKCGYQRRQPDVAIRKVLEWKDASSVVSMEIAKGMNAADSGQDEVIYGNLEAEVMLPGGYNLYNALAATTVAKLIGLPETKIVEVLGGLTTHFGRMEEVEYQDISFIWYWLRPRQDLMRYCSF